MDAPSGVYSPAAWGLVVPRTLFLYVAGALACFTALNSYFSLLKKLSLRFPKTIALIFVIGAGAFAYFLTDFALTLDVLASHNVALQLARSSFVLGAIFMALAPFMLLQPGAPLDPPNKPRTILKVEDSPQEPPRPTAAWLRITRVVFPWAVTVLTFVGQGVLVYALLVTTQLTFASSPVEAASLAVCYSLVFVSFLGAFFETLSLPRHVMVFNPPDLALRRGLRILHHRYYLLFFTVLMVLAVLACMALLLAVFIRDCRLAMNENDIDQANLPVCIVYFIVTMSMLFTVAKSLLSNVLPLHRPTSDKEAIPNLATLFAAINSQLSLRTDIDLEVYSAGPVMGVASPSAAVPPVATLCQFDEHRQRKLAHRSSMGSIASASFIELGDIGSALHVAGDESGREALHVRVLAHEGGADMGGVQSPMGMCKTDAGLVVCDSSQSRLVLVKHDHQQILDGEQQVRVMVELPPLFFPSSIAVRPGGYFVINTEATMLLSLNLDGVVEWVVQLPSSQQQQQLPHHHHQQQQPQQYAHGRGGGGGGLGRRGWPSRHTSLQGGARTGGRAVVATLPQAGRILVLSPGSWNILVLDNSGSQVGTINGPGPFSGLAVDRAGLVYAIDRDAGVVLMMNENGRVLTILDSGKASVGLLQGPAAVAVDSLGNVAVADSAQRRIVLFKHDGEVVSFATAGIPTDVCILDESGRIVVSFDQDHLVLAFDSPPAPLDTSLCSCPAEGPRCCGGGSVGSGSIAGSGVRNSLNSRRAPGGDVAVVLDCNTCFPFGVERLVANATPLNPLLLSSVLSSNHFAHKKCELALLYIMARYLIKERQRLAALLRAQVRGIAVLRREMQGLERIEEEAEITVYDEEDEEALHHNVSFWSMGGDDTFGDQSRLTSRSGRGERDQRRDRIALRLEEDERVVAALRIEINDLTLKAFHCQRRMQALEDHDEMATAASRSERIELVVEEGLTHSTTL
eukprot:m.237641 g.237641  ORF g.237641 m.237641 type:complete len:969 (-) comp21262_c0_seq1:20-2926(-)